jgi:hypothetical protein
METRLTPNQRVVVLVWMDVSDSSVKKSCSLVVISGTAISVKTIETSTRNWNYLESPKS